MCLHPKFALLSVAVYLSQDLRKDWMPYLYNILLYDAQTLQCPWKSATSSCFATRFPNECSLRFEDTWMVIAAACKRAVLPQQQGCAGDAFRPYFTEPCRTGLRLSPSLDLLSKDLSTPLF